MLLRPPACALRRSSVNELPRPSTTCGGARHAPTPAMATWNGGRGCGPAPDSVAVPIESASFAGGAIQQGPRVCRAWALASPLQLAAYEAVSAPPRTGSTRRVHGADLGWLVERLRPVALLVDAADARVACSHGFRRLTDLTRGGLRRVVEAVSPRTPPAPDGHA